MLIRLILLSNVIKIRVSVSFCCFLLPTIVVCRHKNIPSALRTAGHPCGFSTSRGHIGSEQQSKHVIQFFTDNTITVRTDSVTASYQYLLIR